MAQISYLKRRGATYYARMPVPLDLQAITGTKERAKSLDTKSPSDAKRRLIAVIGQWQEEFEDLRRRREVTTGDLADAVWQHYESEIAHDDEARLSRPTQPDIDAATQRLFGKASRGEIVGNDPLALLDATLDVKVLQEATRIEADFRQHHATTMRQHLATGETALIEWAADNFISRRGLLIEKGTTKYRDLCLRLQRAQLEALERSAERDQGDYTGTPKDPIVKAPVAGQAVTAAPGESVLELFDQYARENPKGVKPDTLDQSRYAVTIFVQSVGKSFPAARIDKKAVREWKAILIQLPVKFAEIGAFRGMKIREIVKANETLKKPTIKTKTINRYLAGLGAFCDWLQRNEYIESNPVIGLYQAIDRKQRTTTAFTVDQMNKVFSSTLFTGCQNDDDWHKPGNHLIRDHRYWLPLVMLYSGARPAEIAQLLIEDVRQLHDQWIMHITTEGDGDKTVKTKGSMRVVPIHPELIKLGFISYRDAMKARGAKRLFPNAQRSDRGQMVAAYSRAFPRYLTRIGVKDGRGLSLYSFRHGFIDALRRAEFLDPEIGLIVGHTAHSTTGQYGTLPQGMLRQRVEMIEAVAYPGLKLEHLKPE